VNVFKQIIRNLTVEIATELMNHEDEDVRRFAAVFIRTFLK